MNPYDFLAMTLLACNGRIQGNTTLQQLVYLVSVLVGVSSEFGYRLRNRGPYSDEVVSAVSYLKTIGALDQQVSGWDGLHLGFETARHVFSLNSNGRRYAQSIAAGDVDLWRAIQNAVSAYQQVCDRDYVAMCIVTKIHFLLGVRRASTDDRVVADLAALLDWVFSVDQIRDALHYLDRLFMSNSSYAVN